MPRRQLRPPRCCIHNSRQFPGATSPVCNPYRGFPPERRCLGRHLGSDDGGTDIGQGGGAKSGGTRHSRSRGSPRVEGLTSEQVSLTSGAMARVSVVATGIDGLADNKVGHVAGRFAQRGGRRDSYSLKKANCGPAARRDLQGVRERLGLFFVVSSRTTRPSATKADRRVPMEGSNPLNSCGGRPRSRRLLSKRHCDDR
jgi:hypothetical protein